MPRMPRIKSGTGVYHVILRGNGKQIIFEDETDYRFFLTRLSRFTFETGITCIAYVLMENHVHLLLRDPDDQMDLFTKKLGVSYAQHFNLKYVRSGHLFEGRYRSEPIEDEAYLMVCFRYILKNPQKAGVCPAKRYLWSSYRDYRAEKPEYSDPTMLYDLIGSREAFEHFMLGGDEDKCMEYNTRLAIPAAQSKEKDAIRIICERIQADSPTAIQQMERSTRDDVLRRLHREDGISLRRLERLTGVSIGILQRIC